MTKISKPAEWDKIYQAVLEETGDKEKAARIATARAGSRYGKAKDDPKTPAKPSERQRGSARNPEGSASGGRGGIKLSEANVKTLENKRDSHNEKYKDTPSKRVNMGQLKAVFRRGAGAFSTSHRPSVSSRDQWAIARVNAFLHLMGTGKPKNAKYITDNDLLPKSHSRSTKKSQIEKAPKMKLKAPEGYHWMNYIGGPVLMPGEYTPHEGAVEIFEFEVVEEHNPDRVSKQDSYKPPKGVQEEAERGLEMRREFNRGGTAVGVARARNLANGDGIPLETINRMVSFFARHEVDLKAPKNRDRGADGYPGAGLIAWKLWGGDAGKRWADSISSRNKKSDIEKASKEYLEHALKLAKEALPDWAYSKIHQAARSKAGGKARTTKAKYKVVSLLMLSQIRPSVLGQMDNKELGQVWEHLQECFSQFKTDEEMRSRITVAGARVVSEMRTRKVAVPASKLLRESSLVDKSQLAKHDTKTAEWGRVYNAILSETGDSQLATEVATDRTESQMTLDEPMQTGTPKVISILALSQIRPEVLSQTSHGELGEIWNYLQSTFSQFKTDPMMRGRIVASASRVVEELQTRKLDVDPSELHREAQRLIDTLRHQLSALNKTGVPIWNSGAPIVFVVSEANAIDKARGEFMSGPDGRTFQDLYLNRLKLKKSDVCLLDVSQIEWLEKSNPVAVIALGRTAKKVLGDASICNLPHPKAVRRFGDSGEIERKLKSVSKRLTSHIENLSLDAMTAYEAKLTPEDCNSASKRAGPIDKSENETLAQVEDVDSNSDSQIDTRGDEMQNIDSGTSQNQDLSKSLTVPIAKADSEKKIVYGVVLDPYQIDAQDDYVSPKAIEETAHDWLSKSRIIGFDHEKKADAYPVESSIIPYPTTEDYQNAMAGKPHRAYRMPFGNDVVHSGSWVLGTKLGDSEWDEVKEGKLNAYSIGGYGKREPMSKSEMPEVEFIELQEDR